MFPISRWILLVAILSGCGTARVAEVAGDADERRVWAAILLSRLENGGKVVLLDEIDCGMDEEWKDIPLSDSDMDLLVASGREDLLRFCPPPALESAEAYWRSRTGDGFDSPCRDHGRLPLQFREKRPHL
jgi:hypothetical protein